MQPAHIVQQYTLDPSLAASYDDVLSFVKYRLTTFAHGLLKQWVSDHELNYSMVINLKNNRIHKQTPLLLQRLLKNFGFDTNPLRANNHQEKAYIYLFSDGHALATFREQLAFLRDIAKVPEDNK